MFPVPGKPNPGLENGFRLPTPPPRFHPLDSTLFRGAAPEKPEEFKFLQQAGIKTIISVDRAKPDVAAAESLGLRYIKIPIGYGRMKENPIKDFLKAIHTPGLKGPFYVHCHAGKYRVGAMAAIYRINECGWSNDSAFAEMIQLGGSDQYRSLNASVMAFKPIPKKVIDAYAYDPDKPVPAAPFSERMSEIDRLFHELKKFGAEASELGGNALALEDHFSEIYRVKSCKDCDSVSYSEMLDLSRRFQSMRKLGEFPKEKLKEIENSCNRCHERIRN